MSIWIVRVTMLNEGIDIVLIAKTINEFGHYLSLSSPAEAV